MIDLPNHPRFFDDDSEYPDLGCGELAAKRYLGLIRSADYRSQAFLDAGDQSLPTNLLTTGKRLTSSLRIKIFGALDKYPTRYEIRIYQLFAEVKLLGYRYNYKQKIWEFSTKWKNSRRNAS